MTAQAVFTVACAVSLAAYSADAQPVPPHTPDDVAFRGVNLISMETERVEPAQTVLVRGGRIVAIGATGQVPIPQDARRGDGAGRYLLPGLTDADFNRKVVSALNREGVMLVAGTDAMGIPLVPPGSSLHRELALLRASGLTAYQAIRAATVAPAASLGKEGEFGSVAVGKRADLLLVDGNPLEDLSRLKSPAGVMVRGKWLPRNQLQEMLAALR